MSTYSQTSILTNYSNFGGSLGSKIFKSSGADLVQTPTTDFTQYYSKYNIEVTIPGPIIFTLGLIGSSISNIQDGYHVFISNLNISNVLSSIDIRNNSGTSLGIINPNQTAFLIAETSETNGWIFRKFNP